MLVGSSGHRDLGDNMDMHCSTGATWPKSNSLSLDARSRGTSIQKTTPTTLHAATSLDSVVGRCQNASERLLTRNLLTGPCTPVITADAIGVRTPKLRH